MRSIGLFSLLAVFALALGLIGPAPVWAVTGPNRVNYQGVLRDQNDMPLTGTYDMVFRFMDAATAGNEIMLDQHAAATSNAVTVSGGLFNVVLGSGTVTDGSGPGTYASVFDAFRDFGGVWLEVQVGSETLSPRTQFQSAAYALNSTALGGRAASEFLDTSSVEQSKSGKLGVSFNLNYEPAFSATNLAGEGIAGKFYGGWGIDAKGYRGGIFRSVFDSHTAVLADVNTGISTTGGLYGGVFITTDPNSIGVSASGATVGVQGFGTTYGGYFSSSTGGMGLRASGNTYGVYAESGSTGGYFQNSAGQHATLASGGLGISATGVNGGAYFSNGSPWFSYAEIPQSEKGIRAYGSQIGGEFRNFSSSSFAAVGYSTYKIFGSGSVAFVQNHPADPSKVIVYAAPEGDEVAVYTRGSGRLVNGEAHVTLGETFALVTNPDIGLTATATPRGEAIPLAVSEVTPSELIVRGPAGSHTEFDYMVWGLRIGFEEQSIVQPKKEDSKIPSMHEHEQFFDDEPALRRYTALARFQGIEQAVHGKKHQQLDLSRADTLRDAIGVFSYVAPRSQGPKASSGPGAVPGPAATPGKVPVVIAPPTMQTQRPFGEDSSLSGACSTAIEPDQFAASNPPARGIDFFPAEGAIEAGDVVSLATASPGSVTRSAGPEDALVIGCVQVGAADAAAERPGQDSEGTSWTRRVAVATSNIGLCHVDASYGAIAVGDRLSASPSPGIAMRLDQGIPGAAIIGRAIEPLQSGTALVRVLLGAK